MEVIRVSLTQTAVTALPTGQHRPIGLDYKCAVLTTHHLKEEEKKKLRREVGKAGMKTE